MFSKIISSFACAFLCINSFTTVAAQSTLADYVRCSQAELQAAGFYQGPIDGDPGNGTQAAQQAWQASLPAADLAQHVPLVTRQSTAAEAAVLCGRFIAPWFDFSVPPQTEIELNSGLYFRDHEDEKIINIGPGGSMAIQALTGGCPQSPRLASEVADKYLNSAFHTIVVPEALQPYVRLDGSKFLYADRGDCTSVAFTVWTVSFSEDMPVFSADDGENALFKWTTVQNGNTVIVRPWWTPFQLRRLEQAAAETES